MSRPAPNKKPVIRPPKADRQRQTHTIHGHTLEDDYAWLRAKNWQEVMRDPTLLDARIRTYLEEENAYTETAFENTVGLQRDLFEEMKARLKPDDRTVPAPDGPFEYFSTFVTGKQYLRILRQPRGTDKETILLDGNIEAEGKPYWDLGGHGHSPDHRLLAFAIDDKGSELYTLRFRDMTTGEDLADVIPDTRGDFVWANDATTVFYIRLDENHRPRFVYRHEIGTPVESDVLVYEEMDTSFFVALEQTQSSKFVLINAHDHQTSEVYLIDADAPAKPPRLVSARQTGHEYNVEHHGDQLVITTNLGGAEDFRIVGTPIAAPDPANWSDLEPHRPGRLILETVCYRDYMVRLEREDGLPRIVIRRMTDGQEHAIAFDEEAYALGLHAGYEFDTTTIRFRYSSMTTPAETYDYDMETRARTLRKRQEIPSGHNPEDYVTKRLFAPANDGELVPVTLLYRKSTPLNGTAPLFLYGYGAYGIAMPAAFSSSRLSLVDRGFIFALAHVRGGKDKGYRWYVSGKHNNKTNTFTDFITAAEHLITARLTERGRIVANGGSAGGMLMGAGANMAPDLFLGIIADVPFVDVLNTMLDKDLPLTPPEWPEWGNPIESKDDFETIRSYSPYDNVTAQAYPAILTLAGLTDPRVTYWEPAKWIAKLRAFNTGTNAIYLKTNMSAGHGGASGRFDSLKELALQYAFALRLAGKTDTPST